MKTAIYIRSSLAEEKEKLAASKYFDIIEQRTQITIEHDLIIPRYSALPYYNELENDVNYLGAQLINSYKQHRYVADIRNWYDDLSDITPKTWFYLDQIPNEGPFVLKGETNSKKHQWATHMFAKNKSEAIEVFRKLSIDSLIGAQDICIRQYVPLKKLADGLGGLPISEEYRFFVLDGKIISKAFYWSEHYDVLNQKPKIENIPNNFIDKIIKRVSQKIRFFVFDVARTESNDWILIELNDGSMSGLSMNDPEILYKNMKMVLEDLF